ncbi:MAG: T9SS type A sorting domain-containing protein [Bacteroidales bacterium]|nr:T9SS type A sorting domain-containing protein [Bacteroidales bacterium]
MEVSLYAIDGKHRAVEEFQNIDSTPVIIMLSGYDLQSGFYFVLIRSGNEQVVRKVIVK